MKKQWYVLTSDPEWNNGKPTIVKGPFEHKEEAQTHCYCHGCWLVEMTAEEAGNKVY